MLIRRVTSQLLSSSEAVAEALLQRVPTPWQNNFLQPPAPSALTAEDMQVDAAQIELAIGLINQAKQRQQKVLIYGDYDCDGVTATALLWEALREFGITAMPFLPQREKHGYGLSERVLPELLNLHPDLIITVDNGIVAQKAISELQKAGITVIVTDHHEPNGERPPAAAIIHSTRLAGVTAAWVLAHALLGAAANQWLDYAAIGTIADQVPLYGPSRSFAWHGLQALRQTTRPSLHELARLAGVDLTTIDAQGVHYGLAPRINAMGRLTDAMEALRALVSRSPAQIARRMQVLQDTNARRQQLTNQHLSNIWIAAKPTSSPRLSIVIGDYHEGIIGLIASKLVDQYHRPSIVISSRATVMKASCRSVNGVHITEFLRSLPINYLSLGGHAMAAGFSLAASDSESFVLAAQQQASQTIDQALCQPSLDIVGTLDWAAITPQTIQVINQFAPFGAGNGEPLFAIANCQVASSKVVGKEGQHRQIIWQHQPSQQTLRSICFDWERRLGPADQAWEQPIVSLQMSNYRSGQVELQVWAVSTPALAVET